jgi:predicted nucleic acid-binding protein
MKHPPLAAAFWLSLLMLTLYIAFGSKRRQRVIPPIKPNENTTVTFTETIGRLYLQKKDNKNIAEKMITYFNEHVRNNYFLNTHVVNDDFITALSRKSGVDRNAVESLYRAIQHAHQSEAVDDYQLLSLNQQIQHFYKK